MDDNGNPDHDCCEDPYSGYDEFEEMSRFLPSQNQDGERVEGDGLQHGRH